MWNDSINANENYKKAAAKWEGAIGMVMTPDSAMGIPEERVVIADLWHGDCRGAKTASSEDLEDTPYLITADPAAWKSVLAGKTDPIVGLMGGKLKLAKGCDKCYVLHLVDVSDADNVLDGAWHSDGPNDGFDNNSQTDPYLVTLFDESFDQA